MRNVPANLDPVFILRHQVRDASGAVVQDAALDAMAGAMTSAKTIAEQLEAAAGAITADTTSTPAANAVRLKSTALALGEKAAKALDQGRARGISELERIRAATAAPARPGTAAGVQLESEIRATLRGMTDADRGKTIAEATQRGDDTIIGAILHAPAFLAGLSPEAVELRRATWRRLRHPVEFNRETRLRKALEALEAGGKSLIGFARSFSEGESVQLAEAAQQRARDAERVAAAE